MLTRYGKRDAPEVFSAVHRVKCVKRAAHGGKIRGIPIVFLRKAEGDLCLFADTFECFQRIGIVAVVNDRIRRHVREAVKAVDEIFKRFEIIKMVLVDIEDDRH